VAVLCYLSFASCPPAPSVYTLSLHDALPISGPLVKVDDKRFDGMWEACGSLGIPVAIHVSDPEAFFLPIDGFNERFEELNNHPEDRKSTRLNSSHVAISYAVSCLKNKTTSRR